MIVSLNWIKDYVDLDGIEVDELVKRFGLATAEVESVTVKGKDIDNVVVAQILTVDNHPNSNHLHILTVDDGSVQPVQVVCGAPNVRVGLKTFFARVGGNVCGMKIKPARLAGVESFGMCCGGNELGIDSDESGIVELDDSLVVGTNIKDILPVEDVLIEIDNKSLTNRPDLWGHYGIAREFSAIFKRDLKPLLLDSVEKYQALPQLNISVDTEKCFRYSGISVKNVFNKVSTPIMKLRLNYCGMRDINLLADLTNYVMLEIGQPMHAFDNNIVKGINVIETKQPLSMETLEGDTHEIPLNSVVICDETKSPVAIAGVKGGLKSGICEETSTLLLESACFDCMSIRKTSRKIGLITDASLRYEKSLDPEMCKTATERALYLLKQAEPKMEVTSSWTDLYNYHYPKLSIDISAEFFRKRSGVEIALNDIVDILTRLGFSCQINNVADETLTVFVPSYRATKDVSIKEDLVEEVFRIYGYDNIKSAPMNMPLEPVDQIKEHTLEYSIKYALASKFGLNEVHSYIWNYEDYNKSVNISSSSVLRLIDSSKSGQSGIRSRLLPTLVKIADENKNKFQSIGIFEIGRAVDQLDENKLAMEKKKLSIVLADETATEKESYFKLKEITEYISKYLLSTKFEYCVNNVDNLLHPVNSCIVKCGDLTVGTMGILHPSIAKAVDKRKTFACLELDVKMLAELEGQKFVPTQTSKFQSVSVDFNFVADENMPYGEIDKKLSQFRANYILEYSLKDIYKNEKTLAGKTSYTINYIITPKEKTMEAEDIEKFSKRLIQHMQSIGVELRS